MKSWLGKDVIKIYLTHNEGKSVVVWTIIRNWLKFICIWLQYQKMCTLIN